MGLDFPSSPADGTTFSGYVYRSATGAWKRSVSRTALPKNYVVNPSLQHSQELGLGVLTASAQTGAPYFADQWQQALAGSTIFAQSGASAIVSPNGSINAIELKVTNAGTQAATSYLLAMQMIEGLRYQDLQWGTAAGVPIVLRVWVYCTNATGTCSFSIRNASAYTYAYVGQLNYATAKWTLNQVAIPPPPVGSVWASANFLNLLLVSYCGTTYSTAPNVWTSGNWIGSTGTSQAGTTGADLYFADVGIYADPFNTGVAPPYEQPDAIAELRRCQRYWWRMVRGLGFVTATTTAITRLGCPCPVPMRTKPTLAIVGTPNMWDGSATPAITALGTNNSNIYAVDTDATVASAMTASQHVVMYYSAETNYISVSAR